ncbi:MFS domain-containing protein [Mycena chlorophos]|uniref:MFS domain-containing protein n=1 Tax=Mycena chlorophos TaxID=658473 RepID=A0A8H6TIM3_MYCCL|nr:MFS domain-containing protein [Mycena chlorophos]
MAPNHDEYALPTRIHTAAMIFAVFLAGWNDGTLGPLIPRIQEVYHLGYIIVALLFVFASLGAITGAFLTINLTPKLGFGKMVLLAPLFQIVGYSLQAAALPYPVFALASFLNSIGVSILWSDAPVQLGALAEFVTGHEGAGVAHQHEVSGRHHGALLLVAGLPLALTSLVEIRLGSGGQRRLVEIVRDEF